MFKSVIGFVLGLMCLSFIGHSRESETIIYNVQKKDYTFSTVFELSSPNKMAGSVVKSSLRVRTNYDLYDAKGKYKATAICRVLTLGLFYDWGTEMDVYDASGKTIGVIDGQVVTGNPAKFSFYDANANHVGIGYMDRNSTGFTILDPNDDHIIAKYTRVFVENTVDSWDVSIYDKEAIPSELLHIFAAFAVDRQGSFKPDT